MHRYEVAAGDEFHPEAGTALILQVPTGGTATVETRQLGSGSDLEPVAGADISTGDEVTGTFPEGSYLLGSLGSGVPSLRITGSDALVVGL